MKQKTTFINSGISNNGISYQSMNGWYIIIDIGPQKAILVDLYLLQRQKLVHDAKPLLIIYIRVS